MLCITAAGIYTSVWPCKVSYDSQIQEPPTIFSIAPYIPISNVLKIVVNKI